MSVFIIMMDACAHMHCKDLNLAADACACVLCWFVLCVCLDISTFIHRYREYIDFRLSVYNMKHREHLLKDSDTRKRDSSFRQWTSAI